MGIPDSRYTRMAYPQFLRQCSGAPVSSIRRCRMQCCLHNSFDFLRIQTPTTEAMRGILGQARRTLFQKSLSPKKNRGARYAQLLSNGIIGFPLCSQQAYLRPQHCPLRCGLSMNPCFQRRSLFYRYYQRICWFPHDLNYTMWNHNCKATTETVH